MSARVAKARKRAPAKPLGRRSKEIAAQIDANVEAIETFMRTIVPETVETTVRQSLPGIVDRLLSERGIGDRPLQVVNLAGGLSSRKSVDYEIVEKDAQPGTIADIQYALNRALSTIAETNDILCDLTKTLGFDLTSDDPFPALPNIRNGILGEVHTSAMTAADRSEYLLRLMAKLRYRLTDQSDPLPPPPGAGSPSKRA